MRAFLTALMSFFLVLSLAACTKRAVVQAATLSPAERQERGKLIYNSNCIACHNVDPAQAGSVGPAVKGSSLELLQARILRADYPAGYKPQRDTRVMLALPALEPEIPAIHAYLNQ